MSNGFPRGRVALVTGGATGIGRAVCLAKETEDRITASGARASFLPCDVAATDDVQALVAHAVATFGQLDILVNDAGISGAGRRA